MANQNQFEAIRAYIQVTWDALTRSNDDLLTSVKDPMLGDRDQWPLYISKKSSADAISQVLRKVLEPGEIRQVQVRTLPDDISQIDDPGLIYLPHPYVVPGGRFNEMYGWDSYFILVGLLRDGNTALAKQLVDNAVYQVLHYGKILNANRTYYLTRSQPPLLTAMVLRVYDRINDKDWLLGTLPAIEQTYQMWIMAPHLTSETRLSRYYDLGRGPATEVVTREVDAEGKSHYDRVKDYFKLRNFEGYDESSYYDAANDELTDFFYLGDRSMRESGFDVSNRFGPFNADITNYNPVCLNSLLYRMETDVARISNLLDLDSDVTQWKQQAAERRAYIDEYLWDDENGLYLDYNFRTGQRRYYPFAATFYPLWVGAASQEQAKRVADNLPLLERPGGLVTSNRFSGNQWDAPFGWAPLQLIAVEALRHYGFGDAADRISIKFLSLVLKEFLEHNVIVEKYDVEQRESGILADIRYGYSENVIGFGWTNAVFVELLARLPTDKQDAVCRLSGGRTTRAVPGELSVTRQSGV